MGEGMITLIFGPQGGMADIDGAVLFPVTLQAVTDEWLEGVKRGNDGAWYPIFKQGRQTFIIWHDGDAVFQTHETPITEKGEDGTTTYTWKGSTYVADCA